MDTGFSYSTPKEILASSNIWVDEQICAEVKFILILSVISIALEGRIYRFFSWTGINVFFKKILGVKKCSTIIEVLWTLDAFLWHMESFWSI
jgi:hypothetical protein